MRAVKFDIGGVEARSVERQPQILECLIAILGERAHRAAQGFAIGTEPQLDGLALKAIVKGFGIEIADAVVKQRRHELCRARLAGRVLYGAPGKGEVDSDQRDSGLMD